MKIPRLNHLRSDQLTITMHLSINELLDRLTCIVTQIYHSPDHKYTQHRKRLRPRVPRGSSMSLGDCHKIKPIRFSKVEFKKENSVKFASPYVLLSRRHHHSGPSSPGLSLAPSPPHQSQSLDDTSTSTSTSRLRRLRKNLFRKKR